MDFNIIIPARKGSKGLPKKNQILLEATLCKIPKKYHHKVFVSTDDPVIVERIQNDFSNCNVFARGASCAKDTASTLSCIKEIVAGCAISGDIIMLYLTYPERKWEDVLKAYEWFKESKALSLLCREEIDVSPYLFLKEEDNNKGSQLTPHDYYRRQDYPKCFKLCHMISIFKTNEIKNLNNNLYNKETLYYKISKTIDIDTPKDFEKYEN
jgi:CMP-N,N'-diacetyllegionaminic acid synthase|tara:strand:+ start:1528 stop:2160 length:633 start_codon:yes stop_codon:yes gene_type:complete